MSDIQISLDEAIAAAERGMHAAEAFADRDWLREAERAIKEVCSRRLEFTADDILDEISEEAETHDMRALGPVLKRLAKSGLCTPSGSRPHRPDVRFLSWTLRSAGLAGLQQEDSTSAARVSSAESSTHAIS